MIASLSGTLTEKSASEVTVEVGGVGYRVFVSLQTQSRLPSVGNAIRLLIQTTVREDDISLYGFFEEDEKQLFQKLLSVSGIGPKLALTVLSGLLPHDLVQALRSEDLVRLTAIPGIGRKTAERMIVDLKDKLIGLETKVPSRPSDGRKKIYEETLSALMNLGYHRPVAERTLSKLTIQEDTSLQLLVKEALRILSEKRL